MTDFTLTLGDISFQDFEVPDGIRAGGSQAIDIKRYGGGLRTIDAFGADDDRICWSGYFLDNTAEQRCWQLDAMRKAGEAVALSFGAFSYQVLIGRFVWEYQKFYQIHYDLELEVVADNTQPITDNGTNPESEMQNDLSDANGFSGNLIDSVLSGNMASVVNDVTGMSSISGGTVPQLIQLGADIGTAQGRAQVLANAKNLLLGTTGLSANFASGTNPITMVSNLNTLVSDVSDQSNAFCASNSLAKLGNEVTSILGG